LKAFAANELLQKEKGNLQRELQKVSAELQATLQKLNKLENEKKAGVVCIRCGCVMFRH
jgi:flagellar biosynthesis chaperone FliJ